MKYLVVIGNGLTDGPIAARDNKTPLQLADTPNLDRLAGLGRTGSVCTIPENREAGNDVSFLSLLGYDPVKCRAGAGEFVAAALGVSPGPDEIPLCCDFIVLQASHDDMVVKDYTSGQLPDADAKVLLEALNANIKEPRVAFHAGKGYHNLMVVQNAPIANRLTPPDELIGEGIRRHMPADKVCKGLVNIMTQAQIVLHNHAFNKKRRQEGNDPVNSIWLWGNGPRPALPAFSSKYKLNGAAVTASLLFQGMAKCVGLRTVCVDGASGFPDTNYRGKVEAALAELENRDVVYLQITAPERPSLHGNIDDKIRVLADFDRQVVGPLLQALENRKSVKMLLTVNHMCSADVMRYKKDPVPFAVYPARKGADSVKQFDEEILQSGAERYKSGSELMDALFAGEL